MTEKDRKLLLKDLCGRLSYGVKVAHLQDENECYNLESIDIRDNEVYIYKHVPEYTNGYADIEIIRPYLRPMSSMTEKENKEYKIICALLEFDIDEGAVVLVDWLNKHHFDYRSLIEKGLAISAVNLNIY
jgi:hypothetical protein